MITVTVREPEPAVTDSPACLVHIEQWVEEPCALVSSSAELDVNLLVYLRQLVDDTSSASVAIKPFLSVPSKKMRFQNGSTYCLHRFDLGGSVHDLFDFLQILCPAEDPER